jgi:DNA-binding transcriptional regulator/RsmH inhibitor MraZ
LFEGKYSLALGPEGTVMLPEKVRKEMHRLWGENPRLLCFGAQFLYICQEEQAEALLSRVDRQLCAAFGDDLRAVTDYLGRMSDSVAQLQPGLNGAFDLPRQLMACLDAPRGGQLALLGVDDHLEIWNSERLEAQSAWLERQVQERTPLRVSPEDTPICLQGGEHPCSLLKGGLPVPRRCGPCVYLRLA